MYKILVADSLPKEILEKYDKSENISVDNKSGISKEELMEILPDYDGLVVRSRTKATADVLARGDQHRDGPWSAPCGRSHPAAHQLRRFFSGSYDAWSRDSYEY